MDENKTEQNHKLNASMPLPYLLHKNKLDEFSFPTFPNIHKYLYLLRSVYTLKSCLGFWWSLCNLVHDACVAGVGNMAWNQKPWLCIILTSHLMFLNINCFISEMGRITSQSLIQTAILNVSMKYFLSFVKPLLLLDEHKNAIHSVNVISRFKIY